MMKMKAGTYTNTTTTRELGGLAKTKPKPNKETLTIKSTAP
jgi:hypothetical protein